MSEELGKYIIALDIGTTTLRCQIIDKNEQCIGSNFTKTPLIYPDQCAVEIEPDELLVSITQCIKEAIKDANVSKHQLESLAISTHRGTFITWSKSTGEYFHNFITWKDIRAEAQAKELNNSWKMMILRAGCYLLYLMSNIAKFGIASNFKFTSGHVIPRLMWLARTNKKLQQALKENNVIFATLDTWLVYKLTGTDKYVTDMSNASATGMYDPFSHCWSFLLNYFNSPNIHLPSVLSNDDEFGMTVDTFFGVSIKIDAVMSDQSAAMYGLRSFNEGDLKLTLGTGGFLNLNLGKQIRMTAPEVYPLVGWDQLSNQQCPKHAIYLAEIGCSEVGSLIESMLTRGIISSLSELDVISPDGRNGLECSLVSPTVGVENNSNSNCTKEDIIRSVLESIVFRLFHVYQLTNGSFLLNRAPLQCLRLNGGVAKNDFICQSLADLLGFTIRRIKGEMSTLGVAYMAGIKCGFWSSYEEICKQPRCEDVFTPTKDDDKFRILKAKFEVWKSHMGDKD
ncbi:putative glycerol kinase 5 isoform X2 [Dendroctonus ponderosae]|uniref:Glycerol kinase n=1 Tax=Dendroctonus ponderosae TaxID=77166 RepID=A0AAR5QCT7_DENPD|nr:putative glycerol kinase 5 isoform X2 [Dendroctonus ponderosae]